ncbi:hypothetical protein CEQ90_09500 [Lewinellaceae bacterium SD302]|nr:hypothetical protein CEQ90_09500 [Lewinellaceae bacterium SD302]
MLKLDLLVPVILILCLIALAYILSQVFSPAEQTAERGAQSEIVLDPERYQGGRTAEDTKDLGAATNLDDNDRPANVSNTPEDADELNDYYQDGSVGKVSEDNEDKYYDDREGPSTTTTVQTPTRPTTNTTTATETKPRDVRSGEYHVIAGSFRQKIYAQQRVRELKNDGFSDAYLGYTNRGAFAVAVAGSSSSAATANDLSAEVRQKGYDNFVKRGE